MKTRLLRFVPLFVCSLCVSLGALADGPPPAKSNKNAPVFIEAERIQGRQEQEVEASGKAELRKDDQTISADRMKYFQNTNEVEAEGKVRIEQRGDVLEGSRLKMNLDKETGQMDQSSYRLLDSGARGSAEKLQFEGKGNYRLQQSSYTTCPAGNDDWFLRVSDLEIDRNRQVGVARNASIVFKDVPILYTPWLDFPLNKQRKTGVLAPIFGSTVSGGGELTLPFYWNIAPNRDATIAPRLMTKRGLMLNNEFRYLEPSYSGKARVDLLPDDRIANRGRHGLSLVHAQNFANGWSGSLDLNKVSDDAYFRDLAGGLSQTTQTNLLQQGLASYGSAWGADGSWSFSTLVQRFQTLQDPLAPVTPPYYRKPQLTLAATQRDVLGADFDLTSGWVDFAHPTLVTGKRLTLYPSVSLPLHTGFGYITPKLGIHHTRYNIASTATIPGASPSRTLPILSLDSGVVFEREFALRGGSFTQTLEPRAYYVYAPFRDQSLLPNFDSAETDFNFAQIFTENRFSGSDRINDASQVTLALTSRLLEPNSGNERLRVAAGQRLHFRDSLVTLGTPPLTGRKSDFLAAIGGRITPKISVDAGWQYNQNLGYTEKLSLGTRYQPELGKVINLGYRFTNATLRQIDTSAQWPLTRHWHGVARLNYSLQDSKLLEGLAGLEYNADCWIMRFVFQRFTTATQETSTGIFVQLELNGLAQVGSNPLQALRRNIPGYTKINQPAVAPLDF